MVKLGKCNVVNRIHFDFLNERPKTPPLSDRPADDSFSGGKCLGKPLILVPGLDRPETGRPLQPLPEPP